jgi:hypothetical protein
LATRPKGGVQQTLKSHFRSLPRAR